ncbi:MAG TPA: penicillin-binding protein 1C [Steroidobacteraceae bacterium]|nr:penicillin-binding protein 1C [Steroidobacteraceae bacterium]
MSLLPCALLAFLYTPASAPSFVQVKAAYVPSDAYLLDRNGEVIDTVRIDMKVRRLQWTALRDISPALVEAVITSEDHRFRQHHGVDWYSMAGAMRDVMLAKQRRGASTITMQLAALIERWGHTATGLLAVEHKLLQMRLALTLERYWTKQQILEAYFNLVTFRGELQGVSAMSQVMAGKAAEGLSLPESMVIAALLPAPNASSHQVARRACQRSQSRHVAVSCDQLRRAASILLEDKEPLPSSQEIAPHVARLLLTQPGQVVQSTLDAGIQKMVQQSLTVHLAAIADHNVRDGAVLVVDNDSGDVLAYVGSGGPYSQSPDVDGISARRQAGSTLKPFLYELAFEKKYLTAASLLNDSPLNLETAGGTYIPQDYDHEYKGLVSTRTALGSSLNVPAVRTLILTGVEAFRDRLHQLGYAGITEDGDYYGYSLALGSAEVSVWEQAQAYRALARLGKWSPIHLQHTGDSAPVHDLLSPQASFIVSDIMSDRLARVVTFGLSNHLNTSFWSAAKTGTSKDMRDNWCVGFSQKYTVAVWVGNFEGDPMQDVSGITGAAPVWQDVMLALHEHDPSRAPAPPAGVTSVMTVFSPAVETPRHEWFIDGTALHNVAAVAPSHRMARIDSPANGMVIALDPDIPPDDQRVPLTVKGGSTDMQVKLNNRVVGSAAQQILWTPKRGSYYLSVEDVQHHVLDRILFTVR